jgi:serine/threonine protein kinase
MEADHTLSQTPEEQREARQLSESTPLIDGYGQLEKIGTGSFGTVYRAVQERTGQLVAIKVLRQEVVESEAFQHELTQLSQIAEHPHVVTLLDADIRHHPPYYVMPLLSAGSLDQQEPGPNWVQQVVDWMTSIAEALRYMHGKGLLHCDLKPSNVLLDERGSARLVDFGQARKVGVDSGAFGTLGYMPPEQAILGAVPDSRWDIYAWGATAYRLLGGQCPRFSKADRTHLTNTPEVAGRLQIYRDWVTQRPLLPLRSLNPLVDEDLASIIQSCLLVDPDQRIPSLSALLEDLQRRLSKAPLLCQRPWSARYQVTRFLSQPVIALSLLASIAVPMFVNTYLTVKASYALKKQVVREAQVVNRLTAEEGRRHGLGLRLPLPTLRASHGYQHYCVQPDFQVVASSQSEKAPARLDLNSLEHQTASPDGGLYRREGDLRVGAWSKYGPWTLVSERDAGQALQDSNDILAKNLWLNGLILLSAACTAMLVVRFSRR